VSTSPPPDVNVDPLHQGGGFKMLERVDDLSPEEREIRRE